MGATARAALARLLPHGPGEWPWSTFVANTVGCFALALLLAVLVSTSHAARRVRLLVGTGLLGGFTTFSTFALDADGLARADRPGVAAAYLATGVAAMLAAAGAGLVLGRRRGRA